MIVSPARTRFAEIESSPIRNPSVTDASEREINL